ncbi:MAG: 1,4-alpha-glucan-branching enzyme [Spirochaetales bacterium]|nr:1,4-alpha-glucan-branching enzyme [Spirochaetales bacterium]
MKKLKIIQLDPYLEPYEKFIDELQHRYLEKKKNLLSDDKNEYKNLSDFANGYLYFGFHYTKNSIIYREWAPNAYAVYLTGDFCDWERKKYRLEPQGGGVWQIKLPLDIFNFDKFPSGVRVKAYLITCIGQHLRIPIYSKYVIQDPETKDFSTLLLPEEKTITFKWKNDITKTKKEKKTKPILIYEAHIGMAQEKEGIGTYIEFKDNILPYIKDLGYDAIQLMGIMEHPFYGSFGYQVSNFFAISSRFGTVEDLKELIDTAHSYGILVFLDLVHSHCVKNINEGINLFDGTQTQFFHEGSKGIHPIWDSMLFDYGKNEVIHFLLSNIKYWLTEFHFDGFRFDGITSMIYTHHGLGKAFTSYDMYFNDDVDIDALIYLKLANDLIHEIDQFNITIAEDMSGFPGMALDVKDGGIGFDFRLGMGIPDFFERYISKVPDEELNLEELVHILMSKRPNEKVIAYCESHDQAMVGGKTLFFRLVDKEIYTGMHIDDENLIIDRGIALHKIFRLLVLLLPGEGYLTFIGNEWGHPEWLDFPREGNNYSFKYARRLWSLLKDDKLKFKFLLNFEKEMIRLFKSKHNTFESKIKYLKVNNKDKIITFIKDDMIYAFNLNPIISFENLRIRAEETTNYSLVFSSDDKDFGGFERVDKSILYPVFENNNSNEISIYLPARTALAFEKIK